MDWLPLDALPRHTPASSFVKPLTLVKPLASMRDFAWPSVKLLAPATGAPGLGGLFGEFTAGVFAFGFAGGFICDWANAGSATATSAAAIKNLRMEFPLCD